MTPPTPTNSAPNSDGDPAKIPIEIITEEEMALIDAASAAAAASAAEYASQLSRNAKSIRSITLLAKRGLSACTDTRSPDIEDSGRFFGPSSPNNSKKNRGTESFLHRFRRGRGLSVTDLTATEWCEKQMEFTLLFGKPNKTKAMQAGIARHAVLEEEVIRRVKVDVETAEDIWALKLMNFMVGANQLLFDGLTRELPLVGLVEDIWMVGILDEIRMPVSGSERFPVLVDTKTRKHPTLPQESQKRNGRLQLMCYKYMWDSLVTEKFPRQKFFDFFSLNPNQILSQKIRESSGKSGFPSETLSDVLRYFGNSCCLLPKAHDQLLLRYEWQKDQSLLGEDKFVYEPEWVRDQIKSCHEFWLGKRDAKYPPMEDLWKCKCCSFNSRCPANPIPDGLSSKTTIIKDTQFNSICPENSSLFGSPSKTTITKDTQFNSVCPGNSSPFGSPSKTTITKDSQSLFALPNKSTITKDTQFNSVCSANSSMFGSPSKTTITKDTQFNSVCPVKSSLFGSPIKPTIIEIDSPESPC